MRIHREGRKTINILLALLVLSGIIAVIDRGIASGFIFILLSLIIVFMLNFFRHPLRRVNNKNNHLIYSPADGKVVVIEETFEDEYLNKKCIQVSIFMSPTDVHVNRYPVSGTISHKKHHPGKYLVAWHPKSSTENERTTTVIKNESGEILVRQIAGAMARRIVSYATEGAAVEQGDELGFIKLGSRADIFLPLNSNIKVDLNQKVKAGIDVIAQLS